ncbi:MAG TPA: hypothetical protein ENH92_03180 [Ectothiorhodospiraceae bacterium]|nr:hypothetical protein [Ectothiorhodospiraceae bacterium]
MKPLIHRIAALTAMLTIATFFSSTLVVELFGSQQSITMVKALIVMPGLFILIPAIAITGASGFALSKTHHGRLVERKMRRMPFIALNGLFILLPSAIYLNRWAAAGSFDMEFYIVQGLELTAGAINLILMGLNMRDGLKVAGKLN